MLRLSALILLALPPSALAAAGGGSSGYGGGGSSGGGGYSGGGGSSGSGSGEGDGTVFLIVVTVIALFFAWGLFVTWRGAKRRRERVARTVTASAAAAADDAWFAADAVRRDAAKLFRAVQAAWHARDRKKLGTLVGDDLMVEWERRLDDFESKGWHNQVHVQSGPEVEYVGIVNREDDAQDRVCVRVSAQMRDVVVEGDGTVMKKSGEEEEVVSLAEFWTLQRRRDRWIVVSIEQDAEGGHNLEAPLVPTPWSDDERLRDEAIAERAQADATPGAAGLVDVDFADDARRAALDLSLVDERFAPHVLESAARRAVAAWAEAVDGDDAALLALAEPGAVRDLLYDGDETRQTRLVVRGPRLEGIRIAALEGETFTIEARVRGRRYVEDRDTLALLSGDRDGETTFTERWTLSLSDAAGTPWRLTAGAVPA